MSEPDLTCHCTRTGAIARQPLLVAALLTLVFYLTACLGCGTMKSQQATEQLLLSDAVDQSISQIDFRILGGQKVYLDTTYVQAIKGAGFVNAEYIISSLRQQMFAARCLLQEKMEDADYIVEARVGALGADGHNVIYGLPASNLLSSAAILIPNTPAVPTIPEIALAKRNDNAAAAKVGLFAYHRESRRPVWQSGMAVSRSRAKDFWVMGAGPFHSGSIYDGTQFAGEELIFPLMTPSEETETRQPLVDYQRPAAFDSRGRPMERHPAEIVQANFEADADEEADPKADRTIRDAGARTISDQAVPPPPPAESTGAESTGAESTGAESTGAESTGAESTGTDQGKSAKEPS